MPLEASNPNALTLLHEFQVNIRYFQYLGINNILLLNFLSAIATPIGLFLYHARGLHIKLSLKVQALIIQVDKAGQRSNGFRLICTTISLFILTSLQSLLQGFGFHTQRDMLRDISSKSKTAAFASLVSCFILNPLAMSFLPAVIQNVIILLDGLSQLTAAPTFNLYVAVAIGFGIIGILASATYYAFFENRNSFPLLVIEKAEIEHVRHKYSLCFTFLRWTAGALAVWNIACVSPIWAALASYSIFNPLFLTQKLFEPTRLESKNGKDPVWNEHEIFKVFYHKKLFQLEKYAIAAASGTLSEATQACVLAMLKDTKKPFEKATSLEAEAFQKIRTEKLAFVRGPLTAGEPEISSTNDALSEYEELLSSFRV